MQTQRPSRNRVFGVCPVPHTYKWVWATAANASECLCFNKRTATVVLVSILTYALQMLAYLFVRGVGGRHVLRVLVHDFHIGDLSDSVCCAKGLCVVDVDEHKRALVCKLCLQLLEQWMHCLARSAPARRLAARGPRAPAQRERDAW